MTSEPTVNASRDSGNAVSPGPDASLHAVIQGPWSDSLAFQYCKDIGAYCDVDDRKLQLPYQIGEARSHLSLSLSL
jgi:hypothetical protein